MQTSFPAAQRGDTYMYMFVPAALLTKAAALWLICDIVNQIHGTFKNISIYECCSGEQPLYKM